MKRSSGLVMVMVLVGALVFGAGRDAGAQLFGFEALAQQGLRDLTRKIVERADEVVGRLFHEAIDAARARPAGPAQIDRLWDAVRRLLRDLARSLGGAGQLTGATGGPAAASPFGGSLGGAIGAQLRRVFEEAVAKVQKRIARRFEAAIQAARSRPAGPSKLGDLRDAVRGDLRDLTQAFDSRGERRRRSGGDSIRLGRDLGLKADDARSLRELLSSVKSHAREFPHVVGHIEEALEKGGRQAVARAAALARSLDDLARAWGRLRELLGRAAGDSR